MIKRGAPGNRIGLAVVGALMLIGGGYALVLGFGVPRGFGLAGRGPSRQPLLEPVERDFAASAGWFWYAIAAGSVVLAVACLYWLAVQGRSGALRRMRMDSPAESAPSSGRTWMSARAATHAIEDEIEGFFAVRRASARLFGSGVRPRLWLRVLADERCDWPRLRRRLEDEAVAHLASALEVDELPTAVLLHLGGQENKRELR